MITIREMQIDDLEQVMPIEEANFSIPWTETGFFTFLIRDDALFLVAEEDGEKSEVLALAERYGVSRTPIQQALKRMHTQGMVVFSSKGHFSVPTFSEKEVCDIIEMRLLLEHQALTDIQNKLLPMDFETLERLAGEILSCAAALTE